MGRALYCTQCLDFSISISMASSLIFHEFPGVFYVTKDRGMDDTKSSRKRKRINDLSVDLTGTKFGQLRQVLHELRPYVLEVTCECITGGHQ